MKTKRSYLLLLAFAGLAGCGLFHWPGYSARYSPLSGLRPDPARAVPAGKETSPFIYNIPRTAAEHHRAAKLYMDKAGKYREEAAAHIAMAQLYKDVAPDMAEHCGSLFRQLSALARHMEEMGRIHAERAAALEGRPEAHSVVRDDGNKAGE